ncbi:hypothetical protein [Halobaculum sp. P14]|uniref:hypothetical protein n=1 Tax=Halobaculum sp. P14 TaxID=3421638 RepID=UPI003EBDD73B
MDTLANTYNQVTTGKNDEPMLLRPVDFSILDELTEGRNVGANLHMSLDVSRPYVNNRLGQLADYGLVRRVGPNESVGLYEITDRGRAALELRDEYAETEDFDALIDDYLDAED